MVAVPGSCRSLNSRQPRLAVFAAAPGVIRHLCLPTAGSWPCLSRCQWGFSASSPEFGSIFAITQLSPLHHEAVTMRSELLAKTTSQRERQPPTASPEPET